MHSKQRFKICICLVILGELNLFEIKSLGLQYHFPEKLMFSLPQAIENSRPFLLLRTDILQKTIDGCPWCPQHRRVRCYYTKKNLPAMQLNSNMDRFSFVYLSFTTASIVEFWNKMHEKWVMFNGDWSVLWTPRPDVIQTANICWIFADRIGFPMTRSTSCLIKK